MKTNTFYPSLYEEICEALASFGKLTADLDVWAISEDDAADIYDGRGSDIFEDLKPKRKYEVFDGHNRKGRPSPLAAPTSPIDFPALKRVERWLIKHKGGQYFAARQR